MDQACHERITRRFEVLENVERGVAAVFEADAEDTRTTRGHQSILALLRTTSWLACHHKNGRQQICALKLISSPQLRRFSVLRDRAQPQQDEEDHRGEPDEKANYNGGP